MSYRCISAKPALKVDFHHRTDMPVIPKKEETAHIIPDSSFFNFCTFFKFGRKPDVKGVRFFIFIITLNP